MTTQQVFGPDLRGDMWYFYAYVDGQQVEWGPYRSRDFAQGALVAVERRISRSLAQKVATPPPSTKWTLPAPSQLAKASVLDPKR